MRPSSTDRRPSPNDRLPDEAIPVRGGKPDLKHAAALLGTVLPVWGRDSGDRELMRAIKRTLDPDGVFNPGRLYADL